MVTRISDRSNDRDNNFNLIRMLAASGVLVSHAWPIALGRGTPEPLSAFLPGMTLGEVCVTVFFAISGFFIARSFSRKSSFSSFAVARFLRLFPGLVVVLLLTALIAGAFLTAAMPGEYWGAVPDYVLRNLSLFSLKYELPGVFEANPYGPAINGSLWTLNYEVLCYLGVVLAGFAGLLEKPRAFLGFACIAVVIYLFSDHAGFPPRARMLLTLSLPFLAGMGFWIWREKLFLSWTFAAVFLAATLALKGTPAFYPLLSVSIAYLTFVAGYQRAPTLLRYNRLGDYSYGTYIYAFPVQQLIASAGANTPYLNMAFAFPIVLICAVLSWHLVEGPALGLKKSLGSPFVAKARN